MEMEEEWKFAKKVIIWVIALGLLGSVAGFIWHKTKQAAHIDDAVLNYEQYQDIYNTCVKLNQDLCNMESIPDTDPMFDAQNGQFSKAQRMLAIKTNLNRWIEEYNSKSKQWGRALWKSSELPYQLSNQQFSCNN
jgi:hypothetical protein